MRLGSRVLLELATVFLVGAGLAKGAQLGWVFVRGGSEASAAVPAHVPETQGETGDRQQATGDRQRATPETRAEIRQEGPAYDPRRPPGPEMDRFEAGSFHGVRDELLLAPVLAGAEIEKVKFNRGGSSISLRVDFANGARAAFKPEQTNPATTPRKEVAAYRLNRLMGLSSVPPSAPIVLDREELMGRFEAESRPLRPRVRSEVIWSGAEVRGEVSWWVPEITYARFRGERLDFDAGAVLWKKALTVGKAMADHERPMLTQISSMIVFDFLSDNVDRFSGGNAMMSPGGRKLYYMDNGLSFSKRFRPQNKLGRYLRRVQRFSRRLVERVRTLSDQEIQREMERDTGPYASLLTPEELHAVSKRRDFLLNYVDEMIARFGETEVLCFP